MFLIFGYSCFVINFQNHLAVLSPCFSPWLMRVTESGKLFLEERNLMKILELTSAYSLKVGGSQRLAWKLFYFSKILEKFPNNYFQEHAEVPVNVCPWVWLQSHSELSTLLFCLPNLVGIPLIKTRLFREWDSGKCSSLHPLYIAGTGSSEWGRSDNKQSSKSTLVNLASIHMTLALGPGGTERLNKQWGDYQWTNF